MLLNGVATAPHEKSIGQMKEELREAARSSYRKEHGDLYNFLSVRGAENEVVVLDICSFQKPGSKGSPITSKDGSNAISDEHDETEADRRALEKFAKRQTRAKDAMLAQHQQDADELSSGAETTEVRQPPADARVPVPAGLQMSRRSALSWRPSTIDQAAVL